ncbi:MerR family transcriptional regulator [Actinomycetospora sp. TBRC 11914]|uniref:MerR family transcriptional regulator n=1 Tax=Actinomycetospora sp. TBRC 11914 TaxID=2729387 RepID=UPI00145F4B8E|nr:MerR family transcriptional regulator [Actinomycetospora sp. TBRC 11914]NMO88365.1 MerR family transcriptional regulator [Actinomycetospora sp. TBRC 11914]
MARRLGVAPSTLRSWARRYGLGPADHQAGRYRRYSERDVVALQLMCRLVGQGVVPAAAAAAARAAGDRDAATPPAVDDDHGPVGDRRSRARVVRGVVDAAHRLDGDAVTEAVARHLAEHGVVATWQQVCRPALTALDRRVAETGGSIDAQLVANWAVSTALRSIGLPDGAGAVPPAGSQVLLACVEGEQHTLALEALHAALTEARLPARTLGPSVPESALVAACRRTRPEVAVLWAQTLQTARPEVLGALAAAAGSVLALGPGWSGLDLAELPDTVDTADDLPAALHHIARRCAPAVS